MSIGLSFPLMILLFFPNILKILPKTGEWILTFKKIMGVSFLISGIWLFSIYSGKLDNNNQTDVIKWKTWHLEKNPGLKAWADANPVMASKEKAKFNRKNPQKEITIPAYHETLEYLSKFNPPL